MDSAVDKFTFTLVLPLEYVSTENIAGFPNDDMNAYLTAFDIHVNSPSLNLPPTKVDAKYCDGSKLSYILEHLYNAERMIYDWDGFKLLDEHYDFPDYLAYCCIEFTCSFEMKDYPEPEDLDDDGPLNLWGFANQGWYDDGGISIHIEAMDVFSDALLSVAANVIAIMNLARPGCVRSRCAFVDRGFVSETITSTVPNIRGYKLSDLGDFFVRAAPGSPAYNEIEPEFRPPIFETVAPERLWTWAMGVTGFGDGQSSVTNVGRALNRYVSLFQRRSLGENILTSVAALEAVFTTGRHRKQAQLIENIPLLIPVDKFFPGKSFRTLIEHLYEQRSRFAHGDNNVHNPFIEDLYDQEMRLAAMHAVALLIESLRRLGARQLTSYSPS